MNAVKVGLAGAGPWAELVHAPMFAAGPETELAAIWARRPEAAGALAERYHVPVASSFTELLSVCDAVAFAVPPAVQSVLAVQAVEAGRPVLLEKPIADNLADAERLVDAIEKAGVVSMITLTYRFATRIRSFLEQAKQFRARGGRAVFLTNAYLGGAFATEWRLTRGSLLDTGPHAIDLLEAAIGPVVGVSARHGEDQWTAVTLEHDNGAVSQVSLCSHTAVDPLRIEVELYGSTGQMIVNVTEAMGEVFGGALISGDRPLGKAEAFSTLRAEFAEAVRSGVGHPLDARHGLHLQRIVEAAERDMARPATAITEL